MKTTVPSFALNLFVASSGLMLGVQLQFVAFRAATGVSHFFCCPVKGCGLANAPRAARVNAMHYYGWFTADDVNSIG